MNDYDKGWNDAIEKVVETMKDDITPRLERHRLLSSTYIIDKIAANEVINFMNVFRDLKK